MFPNIMFDFISARHISAFGAIFAGVIRAYTIVIINEQRIQSTGWLLRAT
jgi:hypothetical protein